jgi:hypothetical protein
LFGETAGSTNLQKSILMVVLARATALGALALAAGAHGFALVSVPAATDLRVRPAASTARASAFAVRMSGAPGSDK